jgi:hypothetical protein
MGIFEEIPPIIVDKKIELQYPNGGEMVDGGATLRIL